MTGRDGLTYCHSNAEDEEEEVVQCVADDECECGPVHWELNDKERIMDGGIAPEHEYPWQISLFRNFTEHVKKVSKFFKDYNIPLSPEVEVKAEEISVPHHMCGGSIISTKFIFTADRRSLF